MKYLDNIFTTASKSGKPLLLDGAIGGLLQQRGFKIEDDIWTTKLNETSPDVVTSLHREYIEAGADIITTNTFRTNPAALNKVNISNYDTFVKRAVDNAKKAIEKKDIILAGSNPPAEDCYQANRNLSKNELQFNHTKHIDLLMFNGVDLILNETQSHSDEIKIICEYCQLKKIPYIVSLYTRDFKTILSGEPIKDIFNFAIDRGAIAIGVNCAPMLNLKKIFDDKLELKNWGFYLNCGSGNPEDKNITTVISPSKYANFVQEYLQFNPAFIGTCCGSSPDHTRHLRKLIDAKNIS